MNRLIFTLLLLIYGNGWGQVSRTDSLLNELSNATESQIKVDLCIQISLTTKDRYKAFLFLKKGSRFLFDGDWRSNAKLQNAYAMKYFELKEYELAEEYKEKAVVILEKFADQKEFAKQTFELFEYQKKALLYGKSLITASKARELFVQLKDFDAELNCLHEMGRAHIRTESFNAALPIFHELYGLGEEYNLKRYVALAAKNIGILLREQENYEDALTYYYQAEEIFVEIKDFEGIASVYNNIGNIERIKGNYTKALQFLNRSLENRKKTGDLRKLGYTYNNIGLTYYVMGEPVLAINYLEKAEKLKLKLEEFHALSPTYLNLSEVYLKEKNDLKYTFYAKKAKEYALKYSNDEIRRRVTINNATFEADHGNHERAYVYLSSVFNELDTLDEKSVKIVHELLQAHFRDEQKESQIHELGEVNYLLAKRQEELEENQKVSFMLILALTFLLIGFSVLLFLLNRKQKAYAKKSDELAVTNEQLIATTVSIEEKKTLLKEIHHRVKNNLQIIKSLVRLQYSEVESDHERELLLDFEQRVSSMALVHESLYKSGELAKVNVKDYYSKLIDELVSAYKLEQIITTNVTIEIDDLGVDTLLPLGMLTNEVISNSLKHAFRKGMEGELLVELSKIDEDCYHLFIGDNGKGFNFEVARSKTGSLGVELIQTLVDQLDGTFTYSNENGSYYSIKFKSQEKDNR